MNFELSWLIYDRIVYIKMPYYVSSDDVKEIDAYVCNLLDNSTSPQIHIIFDNLTSPEDPDYRLWMKVKSISHPRFGWVLDVAISVNRKRFISSAVAQILKVHYRQFDSFDNALAYLQYVDETLPRLDPDLIQQLQSIT